MSLPVELPAPLQHSSARLVHGRHGTFLAYPNDFYIGRALLEYGEFSEHEALVYSQLVRVGDHAVEVGANIGALTVPLAGLTGPTGQVSAFEPQPNVFKMLCANLALNELWQVHAFQAVVGRAASVVDVQVLAPADQFNIGAYRVAPGPGIDQIPAPAAVQKQAVPVVALDHWSQSQRRVNFIKVDAEGMELDVLLGGQKLLESQRPVLHVENEIPSLSRPLLHYLFELKYRCYWSLTAYYNPGNFLGNHNNLYVAGGLPETSVNMICVPAEISQALVQAEVTRADGPHPFDS